MTKKETSAEIRRSDKRSQTSWHYRDNQSGSDSEGAADEATEKPTLNCHRTAQKETTETIEKRLRAESPLQAQLRFYL